MGLSVFERTLIFYQFRLQTIDKSHFPAAVLCGYVCTHTTHRTPSLFTLRYLQLHSISIHRWQRRKTTASVGLSIQAARGRWGSGKPVQATIHKRLVTTEAPAEHNED